MNILPVQQGTPEWAAIRAKHNTASEAPAMMGVSKHQTRSALLRQKATGIAPTFDAFTQSIFDKGHAAEAAARAIVEEMIGEELFPATALDDDGYLLASFDGITMLEEIGYEHKLWSEALAEQVRQQNLDPHYYWQLEQQIRVGKLKKIVFVCSDGTRERFVHLEYFPVPGRAEQLIAGWRQFDADLENHEVVYPEAVLVGRTFETLPSLMVQVKGEVLASNLEPFKAHAVAAIQAVNRDLKTDQDFADADKAVKWCGDIESKMEGVKSHALGQTESLDTLFRTIDDISAEARKTRLELTNLIKARKEQRRAEIVSEPRAAYIEHVATLNKRLGKPLIVCVHPDFAGAIKGKRSFDSMADAADTLLANSKIEANALADKVQINLAKLEAVKEHAFLFKDEATIVFKAADDLDLLIKSRIDAHKAAEDARLEAQRETIRQEELAKIEAAKVVVVEPEPVAEPAPVAAVIAAPAPAPVAVSYSAQRAEIRPSTTRIEPLSPIDRFIASRRDWSKPEAARFRSVLVEYEHFKVQQIQLQVA
jgi:predicted phage-related endonuclease